MSDFGRCFLPGPTDVRPEIYAATARTMFFHRGPQMLELLKEIQPSLQEMFGTTAAGVHRRLVGNRHDGDRHP